MVLQELDFVAANVMMALIADFMLVWLPAPTLSYATKVRSPRLFLQQLEVRGLWHFLRWHIRECSSKVRITRTCMLA